MEIGASDNVIMTISLIGFITIGYSIYLILTSSKSKSFQTNSNVDINDANGNRVGGNRAQRRAQRRARQQQVHLQHGDVNDEDQNPEQGEENANDDVNGNENENVNENENENVNENENNDENTNIGMSRKERLKAAKRAEKEERRRMEEHRREELRRKKELEEAAYNQRKMKEQEEIEKMEVEEMKRKKQIEMQKDKEYSMWKNTFTIIGNGSSKYKNQFDLNAKRLEKKDDIENNTVDDPFVAYIKKVKFTTIDDLSNRFLLTKKDVLYRLKQLELSEKVVGILNERGEFTYYSKQEMLEIAKFIKEKGHVTNKILAEGIADIIQVHG